MGNRSRVLSFMSQFSNRDSKSPEPTSAPTPISKGIPRTDTAPVSTSPASRGTEGNAAQPRQVGRARAPSAPAGSRPVSMIQTYQPPLMEMSQDTLPELQPIFTFLNSHANKLYQEGYFLKLDDQSVAGRANADRTWTECFAQLVGTVLSLWDAQELDAAGQDGEVLPKFINLTDASIKMIESLPTRADNEAPLQNVLSISTAGKNRYLLHFNSHHSLIQWTAGIRLSMFEHSTLQEAYTGALIAGKGKALNNINVIMDRSRIKHEDWARVRFGAGTPWRRCWCVISPPDEKDVQKLQKELKKKSAYDRSRPRLLKGDIKFYDTRRTKKAQPIATITEAYSAFAIYPQSKPLIDASTLVKVEGSITIHSTPPSTTEGFVFVMPEVHPAVTGFEMLLRWLFPTFDTFGLYGRPGRLVADTLDQRSLMFAMPKQRRYGYLEILDVTSLILEPGSSSWKESEWRKKMKELTARRMTAIESGSRSNSRYSSRRSTRNSFGPSRSRVAFDDGASIRSSPSMTWGHAGEDSVYNTAFPRTDSAPPAARAFDPPRQAPHGHQRSVSETHGADRYQDSVPVTYDGTFDVNDNSMPPQPPPHQTDLRYKTEMAATPERLSSEDESSRIPVRELQELQVTNTPEPVAAPPAFSHGPGSLPVSKPYHSPELRRANSRMSNATLSQLAGAGGVAAALNEVEGHRGAEEQKRQNVGRQPEEQSQKVAYMSQVDTREFPANQKGPTEDMAAVNKRFSFERPPLPPPKSSNHMTQQFQHHSSTYPTSIPLDRNTQAFESASSQHQNGSASDGYQTRTNQSHLPISSVHPPKVPTHSQNSSTDSSRGQGAPQISRIQTSGSVIARKPLPPRPMSTIHSPDVASPQTASTLGSLGQHMIDKTGFDLVLPRTNGSAATSDNHIWRRNSVGSVYDDTASTATPDYASTHYSAENRESIERPRAGVMRTVGDPDLPGSRDATKIITPDLPDIDFGPTLNLNPEKLPKQPGGRASPSAAQTRYRKSQVPQIPPHHRVDSTESRSVPWQPGMGTRQSGIPQTLTPEQFVQQRAMAGPAMYAPQQHQRQQSSPNLLRSTTPTPPVHSRHNSGDLLQRPNSRGPSAALGFASGSGSGDYSTHLSAREQEHVARVTGQPLITMATSNKPNAAGAGLVGAIETREKEKQQMKQGLTSQAVEKAIAKRQSLAFPAKQVPMIPSDPRTSWSPYGQPQFSQSQYAMNSQYGSLQTPNQAQGRPSLPGGLPPGEWNRQSYPNTPDQQYSPQQQYFPTMQQNPQTRGNQGYHGHGY